MTHYITQHASQRMAQRGCRADALDFLLITADRVTHLNSGCKVLSLSREKAQKLRDQFSDALISRAEKIHPVIDEFNGNIITILKGRLSSYYREGASKHRRGGKRAERFAEAH